MDDILESVDTGVAGESIITGLGSDILQQALQEVNGVLPAESNANSSFDAALTRLLAEQNDDDDPQQILAEFAAGLDASGGGGDKTSQFVPQQQTKPVRGDDGGSGSSTGSTSIEKSSQLAPIAQFVSIQPRNQDFTHIAQQQQQQQQQPPKLPSSVSADNANGHLSTLAAQLVSVQPQAGDSTTTTSSTIASFVHLPQQQKPLPLQPCTVVGKSSRIIRPQQLVDGDSIRFLHIQQQQQQQQPGKSILNAVQSATTSIEQQQQLLEEPQDLLNPIAQFVSIQPQADGLDSTAQFVAIPPQPKGGSAGLTGMSQFVQEERVPDSPTISNPSCFVQDASSNSPLASISSQFISVQQQSPQAGVSAQFVSIPPQPTGGSGGLTGMSQFLREERVPDSPVISNPSRFVQDAISCSPLASISSQFISVQQQSPQAGVSAQFVSIPPPPPPPQPKRIVQGGGRLTGVSQFVQKERLPDSPSIPNSSQFVQDVTSGAQFVPRSVGQPSQHPQFVTISSHPKSCSLLPPSSSTTVSVVKPCLATVAHLVPLTIAVPSQQQQRKTKLPLVPIAPSVVNGSADMFLAGAATGHSGGGVAYVVGNRIHVPIRAPSVLTNVVRPVMATGVTKPTRNQPAIFPKPAAATAATSNPANFILTSPDGAVAVDRSAEVDPGGEPGSVQNPIRLVKEGKMFRCVQPINHSQATSIAKALRGSHPDLARKIVYTNGDDDTVVEFNIVYPEDVGGRQQQQLRERSPIYFSPEELLLQNRKLIGRLQRERSTAAPPRKRGRPTDVERCLLLRDPSRDVKKLRKEFGLTARAAKRLDLLGDKYESLVKSAAAADDNGEEEEEAKLPSGSRTRSGRVSRPPVQIDEHFKTAVTVNDNGGQPQLEAALAPAPAPPKAKRNFNVPAKYRCKVCKKIYLGDRKMNRHVKNHPGHGPMAATELPPPPSTSPKLLKMPTPLSAMPIIPLARTQLEELVKNLDAELVLDVVSKKMFDNFSMWDLQLKKASLGGSDNKGVKVLKKVLDDTEKVLGELKRLVDRCLTVTHLSDKEGPSVRLGEHLQQALNHDDRPLYLEQPNHVPQEYHGFFAIDRSSSMLSPRSELMLMDDNTSSLQSSEDKDPSGSGGGAQMVLERNLGAQMEDDLEEDSMTQEEDSNASNASAKEVKLDAEAAEVASSSRTRLPSFSTIIAGSPNMAAAAVSSVEDHGISAGRRASLEQIMAGHSGPPSVDVASALLPPPPSASGLRNIHSMPSSPQVLDGASSNFLSDLESVLVESNNFSFDSALNSDHQMTTKNNPTPEKLLMKSIPPSSMMKEKSVKTDFLGALGGSGGGGGGGTKPRDLEEDESDSLSKLFDDDRPPGRSD